MRRSLSIWIVVFSAATSWAAGPAPLELDLSQSSSLRGVLVLPPVSSSVVGKKGAFVGVDTRRTVERFVLPAHGKLVKAIDKKLGGKVLSADVAQGVLTRESVLASAVDKPAVLARLAKVTGVNWVVTFTLNNGVLTATVSDPAGKAVIEGLTIAGVSTLNDAQADSMAGVLVPRILELEKARVAAEAALKPAVVEAPLPPPEEDLQDAELDQLNAGKVSTSRPLDRNRVRALVAVGPGATLRGLALSGETANALADLENGVVVGLGINAQLMPLEFFEATSGKAWSQVSLEVHYRRAFVRAQGVAGGLEGSSCTMTDDDLQLRVGARYRLGEGYLPTIGLAGGWSQEQTRFDCSLPLVSTTWRGIDAQLRVRQPLFRDLVTLELIGGPRILLPGPLAESPGFSLSAEAWIEVKPVSILFGRVGVRYSRLQAANPSLTAVDSRTFLALELGAFL
ncbi:MAG: hypothetical protein Q8N23_23275 [Archangium sp.]|nr:hypothetical protein [Archangium sp.]MDP3570781.1 hypothetical protein [Archangium sp.]